MKLITRTAKGEKLTIDEMDGNLTYLESNGFVDGQYSSISDDGLFENLITVSGNDAISITRTYYGTGAVIAGTLAFEPTGSASISILERPQDGTYKIATTTDGNGVDLFVAVEVVANAIVSVAPAGEGGSKYAAGDTITIDMKQLGAVNSLASSYTLQAEDVDGEVSNTFQISTDGIVITNLPTSDPGKQGMLYNDEGTLKISL